MNKDLTQSRAALLFYQCLFNVQLVKHTVTWSWSRINLIGCLKLME